VYRGFQAKEAHRGFKAPVVNGEKTGNKAFRV
jgi:hypothetical protein